MPTPFSTRWFRTLLTLALLGVLVPGAVAQAPALEQKIDEIGKHVQALKQAVGELSRTPTAGEAQPSSPAVPVATNAGPANRVEATPPQPQVQTSDPIARIREEGLTRSQVMQTASYLTEMIGPRLTATPQLKRANEWTRDRLASWGLTNAHLEAWGPFGRGWSLKRFSAQIIDPYSFPLIGYPKAWSPGLDQPLVANVIYLEPKNESDLEKYAGKLKGAVVLTGPARELRARFEPLASRLTETNLLRLANARPPRSGRPERGRFGANPEGRGGPSTNAAAGTAAPPDPARSESSPGPERSAGPRRGNLAPGRLLAFVAKEGAALVVSPSSQGDGGTVFVGSASMPGGEGRGPAGRTNAPRLWSTNAPAILPQIALAIEDYNRLVRMIQQGEQLKMAVELQVQFHDDDLMAYNTVAEIPGTDLANEIVMLGAHLDSPHLGTGATDNAAGVAAVMEAARILAALKLQPRRTIRVGLWSGEEQGLLGSRAYVSSHFGYYTNITNAVVAPPEGGAAGDASKAAPAPTNSPPKRTLVRQPEYDKFSTYFNLDNGTGKIRGVHMQGNEAVRPLFRRWLEPFEDLGAETLTISNTGGTDHQSFDGIGLPGFQFIQDPIDYFSRTHHSSADVFDRLQADDLKQASTILAAFAYNAAMLDEKLPRKPVD